MASVKQETLNSIKWSAIEKFALQGMQFVLGLIMARLLAPSDYGTIGMIAIFIAVSRTFVDSGFGTALIRKLDRTDADYSTVFYFNIIVALLCYGILFIAAPWIAEFFKMPIVCAVLRIQAITIFLNSLITVQTAKLTIELNFKVLANRSILSTAISGVAGVALAYFGYGVWALVAQALLQSLVNFLFIWVYVKWRPQLCFSWVSFKELGSFGSKILSAEILHVIYTNMTTLVIGKFYTAKDLGYYNRGIQFAQLPAGTANDVIGKITLPILAKLQNDEEKLISVYRKYIGLMSMIIFFGCVLIAALAKPLVLILLTDKWAESIIYLQVFAFSIMFDHINRLNLNLLQIKGRSDLYLRLEIIKKTLSFAILFASIPFGVLGICISKVIYTQCSVFINTYYTGKLFGLGYIEQIKDYGKFLPISIITCLPAFALTYMHIPNIVNLICGGFVSVALYWLLLRKNPLMKECLQLLVNRFHDKETGSNNK